MNKNGLSEKLLNEHITDKKYIEILNLKFDYEVNNYSLDEKDSKNISLIKKNYDKVKFFDNEKFHDEIVEKFYRCKKISIFRKNCLKSLISKQKIRFTNNKFDLDLVFITKRVIAMGFPSFNCEKIYRNSINDIRKFCNLVLEDKVKVYNLCIEPDRIYDKSLFPNNKVAIFPFADHNACPIKLMLDFCVDISLFLLDDKENTALIHCKAGKGRTGVMICAYLIFCGICANTIEAVQVYGERRSYLKKGITIPSQKRYIHHFETFLSCNFEKPYFKLIPKIIRNHITKTENILTNIYKDKSYYEYINLFKLKKIKVGPMDTMRYLVYKIYDFKDDLLFDSSNPKEKRGHKISIKQDIIENKIHNYSILEFSENFLIDCDIKVKVESKNINLFFWINLFYITLENFIIIINDYMSNSNQESTSNSGLVKNFYDNAKNLLTYEPKSQVTELSDLKSVKKNRFKLIEEDKNKTDDKLLKYKNCFDVNFYWKNNIFLNEDLIKDFLKNNTKFLNNIHLFDLNNIYSFFAKKNSEYFENSKKKFKIKFDSYGVDKFKNKKKVIEGFSIIISYILI